MTELAELLLSEFPHSSENLRKFAKKNKKTLSLYRVYKERDENGVHGLFLGIGFDNNHLSDLVGASVTRISCGISKTGCYVGLANRVDDVTDWFIEEYKNKGMCAYQDMRHEYEINETKGVEDGAVRACIHCGKNQVKKSKTVLKEWWE